MQDSKQLIRKIDFIFYREPQIRRLIRLTRLDPNPPRLLVKPANSQLGDPTAGAVIRKLTKLKLIRFEDGRELHNPEQWIEVIDETYEAASDLEYQTARARYREEKLEITLHRLSIDKWKYYRVLNHFRDIAVRIIKNRLKVKK